jgi:exopolyphosphatase/pppGpp-phosphohydrolase
MEEIFMSNNHDESTLNRELLIAEMGGIPVDDLSHACHVAHLSHELFLLTFPLHGYGVAEERLLRSAALLHDAGIMVSHKHHHKKTLQIIAETPITGLTDAERMEVACIARYHRKTLPQRQHRIYRDLPRLARQRVDELGGILRLADAFDYEHDGRVMNLFGHVLAIPDKTHVVTIHARHRIDDKVTVERILERTHEKRTMFERTFHCRVSIIPEYVPEPLRNRMPLTHTDVIAYLAHN